MHGHLVLLGLIYLNCLIIHSCVNVILKADFYTGQGVFAPVLRCFDFGLILLTPLESQLRNSYNHTLIIADIPNNPLGSGKVIIGELAGLHGAESVCPCEGMHGGKRWVTALTNFIK